MFLTFWGKPRWAESEHIQHAVHDHHAHPEHDNPPAQEHSGDAEHSHHVPDPHHGDGTAGYHPHESPLTMLVPLGVLALGAVFAGFLFHNPFVEAGRAEEFWRGSLHFDEHLMHAMHEVPTWVKWSPFAVMLIGLAIAWGAYIRNPRFPEAFAEQFRVLYRFLLNKWYFDELYHWLFVRPAFWLGRVFWRSGDVGIIDRFGPNGAAWVVEKGSRAAVRMQSGYLYSYALVMLVGLVGAVSWAIAR
jgi:NADH-quinone oxidoreductase subunit L